MGKRGTGGTGGKGGGGPPLAGLSGVVRMMNGRPAWAVRALMGDAELYITLLSVCERLLKALKSQLLHESRRTSPDPSRLRRLRSQNLANGNNGEERRRTRRYGCARPGGMDDRRMDCLFHNDNVG